MELAQEQLTVIESDANAEVNTAWYYANLGRTEQSREFLARATKHGPEDHNVQYGAALVFSLLGEEHKVLEALERAVRLGYPVQIVAATPEFQRLKSLSRFQAILDKAKE